MSLVLTKPLLF